MKKNIKLNGKLSFNKETIANLNDDQMNNIEGGTQSRHCKPSDLNYPCALSEGGNCDQVTTVPHRVTDTCNICIAPPPTDGPITIPIPV